jgi:hypothetical protein
MLKQTSRMRSVGEWCGPIQILAQWLIVKEATGLICPMSQRLQHPICADAKLHASGENTIALTESHAANDAKLHTGMS